MNAFDDDFLDEHGLAALPRSRRPDLIRQLTSELEYLVGIRITDGMDEHQLTEFGGIIDGVPRVLADFLVEHRPQWQSDPQYERIAREMGPDRPLVESVVEYASGVWLEINRPDYRLCVSSALESLKAHVRAHAGEILQEAAAGRPVVLRPDHTLNRHRDRSAL